MKSQKTFKIGFTYDLKTAYNFREEDPPDANAELDTPLTIETVTKALELYGHEVIPIGNIQNLFSLFKSGNLDVDIVLNIAEGVGSRNRESQVPMTLEMFGIPFVGSDALTLGITLDKILTKKILIADGIPTPKFIEVGDLKDINGLALRFPVIVKPRHEGTSKGISDKSIVIDIKGLKERAGWVIDTYRQPALVEEFIGGREFTVAVLGNGPFEVLPPVQIKIEGRLDLGDLFYTFSRITSNAVEYVCPAPVDGALSKRIEDVALRTYKAVGSRDFGRVDIRVDKNGNPYVLEINPLPSLSIEDVFTFIGKALGLDYNDMIIKILNHALARYGMI